MTINTKTAKAVQAFLGFASREHGGMTAFSMFGLVTCCAIAGLAVDITNLHRQKEHLTLAVDAAAQAGIIALSKLKTDAEIKAAALAAVQANAPESVVGKISNGESDVQLVRFDPKTRALVSGTPNAVKVTLRRDESVNNPVRTGFLRLAGFDEFEISVSSVAFYGQPGECTSSDGIYAKGQVTLTSGNVIGPNYCVHSQTSVWMPQENTFMPGAGVSMPSLTACKEKCVDSANPGVEDAAFAMNMSLPSVAEHIAKVKAAMLASSSDLKTAFFQNKSLATNLTPLIDAKILSVAAKNRLVKGSVVDLTAAQFNDLMFNTSGNLPSGLVYNVDCRDHGNGPATAISIGGANNRKNAAEASTTIETVRQVALITDCGFDVGPYARIDASVAISTRISASSVINAAEGAVVGDPLKNCDLSRKVYIMTMSGVSVSSNFTASNVALIVNGDINVAANSASTAVEHMGTSMHAEGTITIPANHTFNSCSEDSSGLIPGVKTYKFVMPS